jgi:hypothetical protein
VIRKTAAIAIAALVNSAYASAQGRPLPADLAAVLDRAGQYVVEFHRRIAGIVAEERCLQEARTPPQRGLRYGTFDHRDLRSDLLLVNVTGTNTWMEFRDVFEVDGAPVRDRTDRLTNLFLNPSPATADQVRAILDESARYNVGTIRRTVNTPMFPLAFLEPALRQRFRFFRTNDRAPALAKAGIPAGGRIDPRFTAPDGVWAVRFEEVGRPTIIHEFDTGDLPSHGRFWIEPDTGRVVMSEVVAESRNVRGTLIVSYQSEPLLGLLVPVMMRERYEGRRTKALVDATSTYGRFRQFQVNVDEKFLLKK